VLMAAATLSRNRELPEPVRDALGMIKRNVQLEAQLVNDLLDVSRIVHGKLELEQLPVDMHQIIESAVAVTQPERERKNQRLSVALEAERSQLTGDATRLQQVVWNLLGNASKFSPEGGQIRVLSRNEAGSFVFEVSDNGIGIESEAAARIFETFAQANVTITREFGGLGLGLSISKATVDAHGGYLRVESAGLGQGSTFIVSLPLPSGE
jgi:two-component system CheB/CheR fusion protein